jgi:hypothetical protein
MPEFNNGESKSVALETTKSARAKLSDNFSKELAQKGREKAKAIQAGTAPERITESRCSVCTHPYRDWIEIMLVKGMPYATLADRANPKLNRKSISNHYNKHMDLQDAALRAILEQEAKLQGLNIEEGITDIITKRGVLEVMVRKGFEDVQSGVTTVEPRDMVQITKLLAEMDVQQYQVGMDEMRAQMQIFITAIKDVCDSETQAAIGQRVKALRKKDGYTAEIEEAMENRVIEAEVVED